MTYFWCPGRRRLRDERQRQGRKIDSRGVPGLHGSQKSSAEQGQTTIVMKSFFTLFYFLLNTSNNVVLLLDRIYNISISFQGLKHTDPIVLFSSELDNF